MKGFPAFLVFVLALASEIAHGSGFIVRFHANGDDYHIKVYEHVHVARGTRRGAVMVISNPNKRENERTLVVFSDGVDRFEKALAKGESWALRRVGEESLGTPDNPYPRQNLFSSNLVFRGIVDLRRTPIKKRADRRLIASDIRLGDVREVIFEPEFSYAKPVPDGTEIPAKLTLVSRNSGRRFTIHLTAERYIKERDGLGPNSCETKTKK